MGFYRNLDPWESIVFSVIKPLDTLGKLLNKLLNKLRTKEKKKKKLSRLFSGRRAWTPPEKILDPCMRVCSKLYRKIESISMVTYCAPFFADFSFVLL